MSERRTERLVNPAYRCQSTTSLMKSKPNLTYSELPAFLVKDGGLNSGFMLAHCTAAALFSEKKTLCHPALGCDALVFFMQHTAIPLGH